MRNIVVVPYDPSWPDRYAAEARQLRSALEPVLIDIHHICSTSIPGLAAKPVIDILLVVSELAALDGRNEALVALGYRPMGALFVPESRFFAKGEDASRTHHLHAYMPGHSEIPRHLDFRDYLRCHRQEAEQYAELKARLAQEFRDDLPGYSQGKTPLLRTLIERAHQWRRSGSLSPGPSGWPSGPGAA